MPESSSAPARFCVSSALPHASSCMKSRRSEVCWSPPRDAAFFSEIEWFHNQHLTRSSTPSKPGHDEGRGGRLRGPALGFHRHRDGRRVSHADPLHKNRGGIRTDSGTCRREPDCRRRDHPQLECFAGFDSRQTRADEHHSLAADSRTRAPFGRRRRPLLPDRSDIESACCSSGVSPIWRRPDTPRAISAMPWPR